MSSLPKDKLCVDLCSGEGGTSEAFVKAGWFVVRIDIMRKFKPTIIADVCHLPLKENLEPDVLLASPPCQHFSLACCQFPRKGIQEALHIVGACFEAVTFLKPKKWLIENPRARLRHLIGKPKQTIRYSDYDMDYPTQKPTDIWGNIFLPMVKGERKVIRIHGLNYLQRLHLFAYMYPKKDSKRAKIPIGVSEAVLEGVELGK
jgi:hypothetical protein